MRTLAVISMHTSPLAQPGSGDSGGMNVYVRELVAALAQAGINCHVYVRRSSENLPDVVDVEPGFRVLHVPAGPLDLPKEHLPDVVEPFAKWVRAHIAADGTTDALHANYWLSAVAAHGIKHALDLPLVCTFHTLARVKAETGDAEPQRRIDAETEVIGCSDAILANSAEEAAQLRRFYGADPERVEIVPPGVDHAFFAPGNRLGARSALGVDGTEPLLLFVGRIQPLKGLDVAIEALAHLPNARLMVVGGPSGSDGAHHEAQCHQLVAQLGLTDRVIFRPPQPHHLLSSYYRAADVCLVPSRSESFGLVALEAAACGTPVVAAAVGGLLTLVEHGRSGLLVEGRDPLDYAAAVRSIIEDRAFAAELGHHAAADARQFTWSTTAARLRRLYGDLTNRTPVACGAPAMGDAAAGSW
ncbi:MAG: glycosyltransferase [Acidimicrobiales bacterium]